MNSVSSKAIIARARSRFNINFPESDAIEWIGNGINEIGYHVGFVNKYLHIEPIDFTINLPIDFVSLNYFLYNGTKLSKGITKIQNSVTYSRPPELEKLEQLLEFDSEIDDEDVDYDKIRDLIYRQSTIVGSIVPVNKEFYYYEQEGIYKTNATEQVVMFYKGLPLDNKGYPLIENEHNYQESLIYRILYSLMLTGYVHPVLSLDKVESLMNKYTAKASNEGLKFNNDQRKAFVENWTAGYGN